MNSLKKILLITVAVSSFSVGAYNLVLSPDWQVKRWPETRLREQYVQAVFGSSIDFAGGKNQQLLIYAIRARDPEIEEKIFNRLLGALAITVMLTAGLSLLPGLLGSSKEGRLRGAELVSSNRLRLEIWKRKHRKPILIMSGYTLLFAITGGIVVKSLIAVLSGLALGPAVFLLAEWMRESDREPTPIKIGEIEIPPEVEGRHFLISGTTGAGKSMLIYRLIQCARRRKDRGFVMDIGGAAARRFFRQGDTLLAPSERGSVKWNPFAEIRSREDFADLAKAAIPDAVGESQSWHDMGRVLLSEVMTKLHAEGDWSISHLLHYVCVAEREELAKVVAGTPAAVFTAHDADRLLVSVRSVIGTYLTAWQCLEDGGEFSIREWIRTAPAGAWLFCKYTDKSISVMRQMLAAWLKIAIGETLSDDTRIPPETWFVADEFDSLGQVPAAADALTKIRRYGGRCVFGVQTVAQLWVRYTRDGAVVLLSCLGNQVFLRAGDPETAEYFSKALGDTELIRQEESRSRRGLLGLGGDPSKSAAERHATERIVMPSELLTLPDLTAYLKVAGDLPVARIKIPVPSTENGFKNKKPSHFIG